MELKAGLQPIGPIASNRARASPKNLTQTHAFYRSCLFSGGAEPTVFLSGQVLFSFLAIANESQSEVHDFQRPWSS